MAVKSLPDRVEDAKTRLNVDTEYFFRMAYVWKFKSFESVASDARNYEAYRIIPPYVGDYLCFIEHPIPV